MKIYNLTYNLSQIKTNMANVQQILNQNDNYSELSVDASFTLQDILLQPPDQELAIYNNIQQIDNFDVFFQDDQPSQPAVETPMSSNLNNLMKEESDKNGENNQAANLDRQAVQSKIKPKTIRRWARLADLPLPSSQNIRNMVYIVLKNVSEVFDIVNSSSKGVGVPTCISATGTKFLAVGTSIGNIVVFQVGVKGNRNLSTPDQYKYGQVISISVSRDNRYLVAGYETGLVILWDLYGFKLVKTILLQKNRILKVLFCSENYQNFISSDSEGYLYMYSIQNYLWTGVKTQLLIDKTENIYHGLKYSKIKSGKAILALSSFNSILLVILKPSISVMGSIERPSNIGSNIIPNCQIGTSQEGSIDYLCVSWGRYIYIHHIISEKNQNQRIQLDFIIEQPSGIHNMEFITNGILVTIDKRQVYRVINLLSQKQKVKDNSLNNCVVGGNISVTQLQAQTIYQRYLKDKQGKYLKCYSNTMVNCSYNPRYKEIFLISKNAVYRGRLQKWTDYIHYLLTEVQNWELALKLCLELYKGKYNIFAQPFVVTKTTVSLLCDIGKIFFKERMKQLQKKRTQQSSINQVIVQARELFEITIEFFCSFGCEDFMFENIYKNLKQKFFFQYGELFIQSLEPFIEESLIHKIPTRETFLLIIQAFSKRPQILNKLIIGLHQDCLYFSDIVQICSKQKLYESLSYICSVNGDFISPANKIIAHLEQEPHDTVQYSYLKDYLNKLTDMKYPNGKQIGKNKDSMLKDLAIWLGCDETLQYMIKRYPDDYFSMLSKLSKRLLEYDLVNQIPAFISQVISKMNIIRQNKLLPKFLQFSVNVGLSQKIHYSQQILRNILDACVQMYDNYNSAEFKNQFKYVGLLRFIEKYLMDKHQNIKSLREQYDRKLLTKVNIWVRLIYKMLSKVDRQQLLQESPQLLKKQDTGRDAVIGYLFENFYKYKQIIDKYQDLLIRFSPEQSLIYIIQDKKSTGVKQINTYVMKIQDQKLRYAVIRKILRLYRIKNKQFLNQPMSQVTSILKQSIKLLSPNFMIIADSIVQTNISDEILLFYVDSICKYKKEKRVFYQLIQNEFQYRPIVTKLEKIFQKYKYRSCLAFIYEQKLKLREAFTEYQFVYQEYFNQNFRKLISHEHCHGRFMARIFHIMLDLCFRINKQEQWGYLISAILSPLMKTDFTSRNQSTKIIDTIQTIYEKKSSKQHPFMQQLIDVIELTLTSMSRQVSIDLMAVQLNKYTVLLNKSFIVNCLVSTLKSCQKRVQTYEISKKMMIFDFVTQFEQFFTKNKLNGSPTDQICDQCGLQASSRSYNPNIEEIKFEVLKCSHGYHDKCFQKNHYKCKVCTQNAYGDIKQDIVVKQEKVRLGENIVLIQQKEQEGEQNQKKVYQYLALEEYRRTEEQKFSSFIEQYEGYITNSKNL